jgi:hypothetical protein
VQSAFDIDGHGLPKPVAPPSPPLLEPELLPLDEPLLDPLELPELEPLELPLLLPLLEPPELPELLPLPLLEPLSDSDPELDPLPPPVPPDELEQACGRPRTRNVEEARTRARTSFMSRRMTAAPPLKRRFRPL